MARNALGKGLSALIREPEPASQPVPLTPAALPQAAASPDGAPLALDIDLLDSSPYQPRVRFREAALEELAQSIRASGIIQPLLVRRKGPRYQLIAGERRWRAAQRAGLQRVPVIIRDVPEEQALEITLVENLQREDLNPIEQARAFERLVSDFRLTQEEVAARTGKDRATVANAVRLLKLEGPIQQLLEEGQISAGHGRALLGIADAKLRLASAQRAARGGVTVRQLERVAARSSRGATPKALAELEPNVRAALQELTRALGTRVQLRPRRGKKPGQLQIEYYSEEQLEGLYERLLR